MAALKQAAFLSLTAVGEYLASPSQYPKSMLPAVLRVFWLCSDTDHHVSAFWGWRVCKREVQQLCDVVSTALIFWGLRPTQRCTRTAVCIWAMQVNSGVCKGTTHWFLQPAMRLWSQLLLLAPQLEWLHRCWWRWVRSSAHPQSKAWVCTALCLAGHLHCSTAVLKPKEWVTIKCRSLQPEGNLPVMDSNTPIGLFRSLRCLNSCSLIFKHFSSRDLKVLCEL